MPAGAKICQTHGEYKGGNDITRRVGNVVTRTFVLKRGLNVGKSQNWQCQHLGLFFQLNFISTYNIRSPKEDSKKKIVLCKKGDDITQLDGTIKPTQTGIYRNKYIFCPIKSLEPLKNSHTLPCPLVRSSSLNFGQNF
jgi:hypothetical protein